MIRKHPILSFVVILLMLVGAGLAAGCTTQIYCSLDLTFLPTLRSDPVANMELPGTAVVRHDSDPYGWVLGKPSLAEIEMTYEIDDPDAADEVLAEAVEVAENARWSMAQSELGPTRFEGSKHFEVGTGTLTISLNTTDLGDDPDRLFVHLFFLDP